MRKLLYGVLGVVAGVLIGGMVNMALIKASPSLIPPPAGVDVTNAASLAQSIHLFEPRHFIMPFLAHALGTFVGALVAWLIAATARPAWAVGIVFLVGGVAASYMIPAPIWFKVLDLVAAYLPMAWLAIQLGRRLRTAAP